MASKPSKPIVFYDIAMRMPRETTCCSPNPWKTRLALNFKSVPYSTSWVALPDIAKVRSSLKVPACRKFADGSDFSTLPVIQDPTTDSVIGDSFDIALYLQDTYPNSGAGDLFPPQPLDYAFKHDEILIPLSEVTATSRLDYAQFNVNVDAAFTTHVALGVANLPFDPAVAEQSKAEFVRRAGLNSWDDFTLAGEARQKTLESFQRTLGDLARLFTRDTSGPYLLGERASYADLIVGGWLRMMSMTLPTNEWDEVKSWHGGVFGRLHDALAVFAEVK